MFLIAASIHIFGIVFYAIFANAGLQDWASQEQEQILVEKDEDRNKQILHVKNVAGQARDYGSR